MAQISHGSGAIANLMVNSKAEDINKIRAALSKQYAGVNFSRFKPLAAIIESANGQHDVASNGRAETLRRFKVYHRARTCEKFLKTPDYSIKRGIDALKNQLEGAWIVKMLQAVTSFGRV